MDPFDDGPETVRFTITTDYGTEPRDAKRLSTRERRALARKLFGETPRRARRKPPRRS